MLYTLARRSEVRSDVLHAGGRDVVKIASALPGSGLEEERVRRWGKWLGETLRDLVFELLLGHQRPMGRLAWSPV